MDAAGRVHLRSALIALATGWRSGAVLLGIRLTSLRPVKISLHGSVAALAGTDDHGRVILALALEQPTRDAIYDLGHVMETMHPEVAGAVLLCGRPPRQDEWAELARGVGTDRVGIYIARGHRLDPATPPPRLRGELHRRARRGPQWTLTDSVALMALAVGIILLVVGLIGVVR